MKLRGNNIGTLGLSRHQFPFATLNMCVCVYVEYYTMFRVRVWIFNLVCCLFCMRNKVLHVSITLDRMIYLKLFVSFYLFHLYICICIKFQLFVKLKGNYRCETVVDDNNVHTLRLLYDLNTFRIVWLKPEKNDDVPMNWQKLFSFFLLLSRTFCLVVWIFVRFVWPTKKIDEIQIYFQIKLGISWYTHFLLLFSTRKAISFD